MAPAPVVVTDFLDVRMGMEMRIIPAPVHPYFIRNCSSITYLEQVKMKEGKYSVNTNRRF